MMACVSTSTELKKWQPEERAEAHVRLGMTYLRENQYETASIEFDTAIAINPLSDSAHHAKGLLLSRTDEKSKAMKFFSKAVSINPKNYLAVNDYGVFLCQNNQNVKGMKLLKGIEQDAANPNVLNTQLSLGICYLNGNNNDQASRYLRLVLGQSPRLPQALLPMAEISVRAKNFLSARAFLERYFGTGSISERSLYLASTVEYEMDDLNKANQYRRELRKRFPGSSMNARLAELFQSN